MLRLLHGSTQTCDGLTRREALHAGSLSLAGLTLPGLLRAEAQRAITPSSAIAPRAKSVIVLFLSGGPSQLDMWDPKPDAPSEIRGTFEPIATNRPGIQITEYLPRLARNADKFCILRSVSHPDTNHPSAAYWMMVGTRFERPQPDARFMSRLDRPNPGSALHYLLGSQSGMPPFVLIPEAIAPNGPERAGQHAGFLGAAYDPYRINSDPNLRDYSPGPLRPPSGMPAARLTARHQLLRSISRHARYLEASAASRDLDPYYAEAFDLVSSPAAQRAFDVSQEPAAVRERYGWHVFGQSVLVARRLVEAGVRLVQVNWVRHDRGKGGQGFDSHRDHLTWARSDLLPPTDHALAALLEDLHDRGLLQETMVICTGEFGRTPRFNTAGGRDHWPQCFSVVLAGGGIAGGQVYGSSDKLAAFPASAPVSPQQIIATLYHSMGIAPRTVLHDGLNRPHTLVDAEPLHELLSQG
ncbi:MAG TPA: DUF1501 domain-containing protein [Planctomycetaceae bacterium]|jgi:hypothetical protein|nr:DUF1501 domain-containing protein [Planctomycetaceae bacterium]